MNDGMPVRDLALVGGGYWGKNLARNFRALGVLHTICDVSDAALAAYGPEFDTMCRETDPEKLWRDTTIHKVAIATPAATHYAIAKAALKAGKDAFVEKPLCLDEGEAEDLQGLAETEGRILMVGHLLQYHPCVQRLKSMVAEGVLGRVHYITSNRLNLGKIRREENALWSFAPHDLSVILSLVGDQLPEQVRCVGGSYLDGGIADTTLTTLKFPNGVRAHVYVSWLNPFKEQKLTVVGSGGMAVFDDTKPWGQKLSLHRDYLTWLGGSTPTPNKVAGEVVDVAEAEPLREECLHFVQVCRDRSRPRTDAAEGLRILRVLHMAQRSLERDGEAVANATATAKPAERSYFVHPTALVDEGAVIGKGTKVWHFCHVMKGAQIGEHCVFGQNVNVDGGVRIGNNVKVQNNVSIYTGLEIEDDVFLGPSCVLTNVTNPRSQVNRHSLYEKTVIRRGATVGANATIVCGVTLGRYCFVAAGAVVTKDVPDYALVVGNPARQKGWMSRHGHVLKPAANDILKCPESGFRYREDPPGTLRCLDLDEGSPLPAELAVGTKSYDTYKG